MQKYLSLLGNFQFTYQFGPALYYRDKIAIAGYLVKCLYHKK